MDILLFQVIKIGSIPYTGLRRNLMRQSAPTPTMTVSASRELLTASRSLISEAALPIPKRRRTAVPSTDLPLPTFGGCCSRQDRKCDFGRVNVFFEVPNDVTLRQLREGALARVC